VNDPLPNGLSFAGKRQFNASSCGLYSHSSIPPMSKWRLKWKPLYH